MPDFMKSKLYAILIFFVIMPLNGIIMLNNFLLGLIIALTQVPWFLDMVVSKLDDK